MMGQSPCSGALLDGWREMIRKMTMQLLVYV
jgi:hypothetical protein